MWSVCSLFLGDGERVLVHELPNFLLQYVHNFSQNKNVCIVQVLNDELLPQSRGLIQVQEELLHRRIAEVEEGKTLKLYRYVQAVSFKR